MPDPEPPYILHMLSPQPHVSPFDVNMAIDAGVHAVVPYVNVEVGQVNDLVQDAIFSRSPKRARRTGVFIGGNNIVTALEMMDAATAAMVPPFGASVVADPAGSFTTAAAMVAKVERALADGFDTGLSGLRVVVYGATGVVGFSSAVLAAGEGATAVLVGYDGPARVERLAEQGKERFGVDLEAVDGSTEERKVEILRDADVILCGGRAGVRVLDSDQVAEARRLRVAADVNAVPPLGLEAIEPGDDGEPIAGTEAVGIGALAIGQVKYGVEAGLFERMLGADEPLVLDFRDAFEIARSLVG